MRSLARIETKMGLLSSILGSTAGKLINAVGSIIDEFHTSGEEKMEASLAKAKLKLALEEIITARMTEAETTLRTELTAKSEIIQAEMNQKDNFTKRARPTLVYTGLAIFVIDMAAKMVAYFTGYDVPAPSSFIDPNFIYTWGGVCGVWFIGRSAEKYGMNNKAVKGVTGTPVVDLDL